MNKRKQGEERRSEADLEGEDGSGREEAAAAAARMGRRSAAQNQDVHGNRLEHYSFLYLPVETKPELTSDRSIATMSETIPESTPVPISMQATNQS
uniref:Uncharacterized protein n=1 Tax=Oryza punctata TaxID=4537 RepID=A0A0E0K9J7_ORYPU